MKIITSLSSLFENLEDRKFYQYISIFLGFILLITVFMIYRFYSKTQSLERQIRVINDLREEDVVPILRESEKVHQERAAVNKMLEEDRDFKIGGFFKDLLASLNLTSKIKEERTSQVRRDDEYQESILEAKFTDMSMQELCELLYKVEQTMRVYPKNLEIVKSKKSEHTIDVNLTIATLQKAEPIEL